MNDQQHTIVKNGTIGTVSWELDSSGTLSFGSGSFEGTPGLWPWTDFKEEVKAIFGLCRCKVSGSLKDAFFSFSNVEEIDLSGWDTSYVRDMSGMFERCFSLKDLHLDHWNTSNVRNMAFMFRDCHSLTALNLNEWNTSGVLSMHCMFASCTALQSLEISKWNLTNAVNLTDIVYKCPCLPVLSIESDTIKNTAVYTLIGERMDRNGYSYPDHDYDEKYESLEDALTSFEDLLQTAEDDFDCDWIDGHYPYYKVSLRDENEEEILNSVISLHPAQFSVF